MRGTRSGVKSRANERRVKKKNDDTSNPSFLSVPHNSFVIVIVIAFFRNIVYLLHGFHGFLYQYMADGEVVDGAV